MQHLQAGGMAMNGLSAGMLQQNGSIMGSMAMNGMHGLGGMHQPQQMAMQGGAAAVAMRPMHAQQLPSMQLPNMQQPSMAQPVMGIHGIMPGAMQQQQQPRQQQVHQPQGMPGAGPPGGPLSTYGALTLDQQQLGGQLSQQQLGGQPSQQQLGGQLPGAGQAMLGLGGAGGGPGGQLAAGDLAAFAQQAGLGDPGQRGLLTSVVGGAAAGARGAVLDPVVQLPRPAVATGLAELGGASLGGLGDAGPPGLSGGWSNNVNMLGNGGGGSVAGSGVAGGGAAAALLGGMDLSSISAGSLHAGRAASLSTAADAPLFGAGGAFSHAFAGPAPAGLNFDLSGLGMMGQQGMGALGLGGDIKPSFG
jgi:hypothetical protein